jgi:hypothetical protein
MFDGAGAGAGYPFHAPTIYELRLGFAKAAIPVNAVCSYAGLAQWLVTQEARQDEVGELARDLIGSPRFCIMPDDLASGREFMTARHLALHRARKEYRQQGGTP